MSKPNIVIDSDSESEQEFTEEELKKAYNEYHRNYRKNNRELSPAMKAYLKKYYHNKKKKTHCICGAEVYVMKSHEKSRKHQDFLKYREEIENIKNN